MTRWSLGAILFGALGCVTATAPPVVSGSLRVGTELNLKLPSYPDGALHDFVSDRGKVVLLDIWATYCEPCKETLPLYQDLVRDFKGRGFRVYAVSEDEDTGEISKFLSKAKLTLPILRDPGSKAAEQLLAVKVMPTTFLIDRRGVIRKVHEGTLENVVAQYEQHKHELEPLLAEPAP